MDILNKTWASQQDPNNLSPLDKLLNNYLQNKEVPLSVLMSGDVAGFKNQFANSALTGLQNYIKDPAASLGATGLIGVTKQFTPKLAASLLSKSDIEAKAFNQLKDNLPAMKQEYAALNAPHADTMGGRVLNTDAARELFPEYKANRTLSADVHEPASQFVKDLYKEKLSQPTPEGFNPTVVFTAGGTGAGKTGAIRKASSDANDLLNNAEMIYDTNMNKFSSADQKVKQALNAGRDVQIFYTYRDPVDALVQGALPRAARMETNFGSGRTVPIQEHLKTHMGSRETIQKLADKYKGNDNVHINVIDNSGGVQDIHKSSLDKIPKLDENEVRRRLNEALEQNKHTISEHIYKGTKGTD
jgi:hypothetical protein